MSTKKKRVRQNFRTEVFERDGHCCRVCGYAPSPDRAESELDAHHITDRNEMPNGGYVAENGITLCAICHRNAETHHCGAPVPPGFSRDELYELIGSSADEARAASES